MVKKASTLSSSEYKTDERLNCLEIYGSVILSIIKNLIVSKAHGWDKILIRIIKLCSKTIAIPLKLIFRAIAEEGAFLDDWKN